jgi:hypothetical protein
VTLPAASLHPAASSPSGASSRSFNVGLTITQVGSFAGLVAKSGEFEALSIPAKVNLGVAGVTVGGLSIPAQCSTSEPVSLNLAQTLDLEELLSKGWSFTGTTSIPTFKCEGEGIETNLLAGALSAVLSGPENPFSLAIPAPEGG